MSGETHTEWYYAEGGKPQGPVGETTLRHLAESGTITATTLVWNAQLPSWMPYGRTGATGEALPLAPQTFPCVECGHATPSDEGIRIGNAFVCAACKPVFLQRLQQGLATPAAMHYAGFGVRFCAKFIDGTLLSAAQVPLLQLVSLTSDSSDGMMAPLLMAMSSLFGFCLGIAYGTGMVGRYGATVGKMAMGLRVVRADGSPVGYARALGRSLSEIISAILMNIGYLMAAFDVERRTLHDRICETRVIVE